MKDLAPHITRQRLLIEGFYSEDVDEAFIKRYYTRLTTALGLRVYAEPIIHSPAGEGKDSNQGYDCFVPLIDFGIYVGAWANEKFFSAVIYTCKAFDEKVAVDVTKEFWGIDEAEILSF
jgi:S-adenosylmethionine decarboxylase